VVFFGARDLEQAESYLMEKGGMRNFSVSELREKGVAHCVEQALKQLEACDMIYLSFDVDSMDCEKVSMGTGTPVKDGLFPEEAREILQKIVASGKVVCFDIVEINPTLDNKGNTMAETAFDLLKSTVEALEEQL
jgi:arginase